ncbi:MAG: dihydroorotate dehydrogenase-like protein [Acidobacteria bacterium]|nr:dihydroorotate dehydrogenase-like protein [Acidobacteriota bacterium]
MDLSTEYLGLTLRTPLVASASPLSHELDSIRRLEDAGASAVVLYSLFEEQLRQESVLLEHNLAAGTESFAESLTYFPRQEEFHTGPEGYLEHIRKTKAAVDIPVIASLNGASLGGWADYAHRIEQAGANALECNIYFLPTNPAMSCAQVEDIYVDILREVKLAVKIPVAVKLSPYFSNMAFMAQRLDETGANGLVLFNRFYQPDIDLETLELRPNVLLSTPQDLRLPLTWIGILYGRVKADLAATSGIHQAEDVIKMLLVGAKVTMMCSILLREGHDHIRLVERLVEQWLADHEYESVRQLQGSMSQIRSADPAAFERAQYMRAVKGIQYLRLDDPSWRYLRED